MPLAYHIPHPSNVRSFLGPWGQSCVYQFSLSKIVDGHTECGARTLPSPLQACIYIILQPTPLAVQSSDLKWGELFIKLQRQAYFAIICLFHMKSKTPNYVSVLQAFPLAGFWLVRILFALVASSLSKTIYWIPFVPEKHAGLWEQKDVWSLKSEKKVKVAQSCLTLRDPMDCSPPGSSVHGIFQARMLEWVAMPFSRRSSRPRDWTQLSHIAGGFLTAERPVAQKWHG